MYLKGNIGVCVSISVCFYVYVYLSVGSYLNNRVCLSKFEKNVD